MIIGNINQLTHAKIELPTVIYEVLETIHNLDFSKHADGEMIKNDVIYKTFQANTAPLNERVSETHEKNIDVQFVISGVEGVKYQPKLKNQSDDPYPDNDNYFYHSQKGQEQFLILNEGDFAILFPWDIHAPLCQVNEKHIVRKIVAKVPLLLLEKH